MINLVLSKIFVVIVVYKQDLKSCISLNTLNNALLNVSDTKLDVMIYDNSPYSQDHTQLNLSSNMLLHYIHDYINPGVSKAYNTAAIFSKKLNKEWLLILDHDTNLPSDSLNVYANAIINNKEISLFSPILMRNNLIISPAKFKHFRGYTHTFLLSGICNFTSYKPINSGMLINLLLFEKVGGYNENFKLDYSDFDFISRVENYIQKYYIIDLQIQHQLSGFNFDNIQNSIERHIQFCASSKNISTSFFEWFILAFTVLKRSINLSYTFKNICFIRIYLNQFMFNNNENSN